MSAVPALIENVSVLYVDPGGPYPGLVRDWYDEERDARTYAGPNPIVAHPPCGPWSALKRLNRKQNQDCAPHAVELVRRYGGVLEHPAGSGLWPHCNLPRPGSSGTLVAKLRGRMAARAYFSEQEMQTWPSDSRVYLKHQVARDTWQAAVDALDDEMREPAALIRGTDQGGGA